MLNDAKIEVIFVNSKSVNSPPFRKITIGDSEKDVANAAKNLGVIIDKHLDMKVNTWIASQLNALSTHLCHQDLTVVTSLLYGLPDCQISKLQHVQIPLPA